jgi:hypothetical protein
MGLIKDLLYITLVPLAIMFSITYLAYLLLHW